MTRHPLAPLAPDEITAAKKVLIDAGMVTELTRFGYVMLREPDKKDVLAWDGESPLPREVTMLLTELAPLKITTVVVELTAGRVVFQRTIDPAAEGFGPCLDEDYIAVDEIVKSDAGWVAAMAERGITDLTKVKTAPLSAGVFGYADEVGRRMLRVLSFYQPHATDSAWAHPIDGVVAHVDLDARKVLRLIETDIEHVPQESADYLDPAYRGPERTDLKPISITQPEGVSFTLQDGVLAWQNWKVRLGFNGREGLTVHQVSFSDRGVERPILYRGSIAEMVVNYGQPGPMHGWQNYFDTGEYQFGRLANHLELGCDCLGEITYADAVVVDDLGEPLVLPNAICIHEEDFGVLWKHTDIYSGSKETRRQRRLVVSFFVTVGNYDYGFYWYFYLDGTIELEAKATGVPFPSGHGGADPYSTEVAPGVGAPVHQHLFSARLDLTIDGIRNHVDEFEAARVPLDEKHNPWGNAIGHKVTRLRSESEAQREAANHLGRIWRVSSDERLNRMGQPTSYVLVPEGLPTLLADPGSPIAKRATFAQKHLWVTQYERDELWPSGYTVNQHPGGAGLPAYVAGDRSVDGEDVVLWHTFGLTHYVRLEDWPIMPVDYAGFKLKPHGFFDRNPTIDVPDLNTAHGCCAGGACHCGH